MVTVSPVAPPVADMVGVLSLVTLSVDDAPRSDAVARSVAPGVAGGTVSTVIVLASTAAPGPAVPPELVTDVAASRGITVPSVQFVAMTVKVVAVPVVGDTEYEHVEVPAFEKSVAETVVASTVAEKVSEYVNGPRWLVDDGLTVENEETPNATYLIITTPEPPFPAIVYE